MRVYKPYTYRVICPDGRMYYGVKYANNKRDIANPETFWVSYFTSCSKIHDMLNIIDRSEFKFEIRKTFNTASEAIEWESKVNKRFTTRHPNYLNDSWIDGRDQSGSNNGNYGKVKTPEQKRRIVSNRRIKYGGAYRDMSKPKSKPKISVERRIELNANLSKSYWDNYNSGKYDDIRCIPKYAKDKILELYDGFSFPSDGLLYKTAGARKPCSLYFAESVYPTVREELGNFKHAIKLIQHMVEEERPEVKELRHNVSDLDHLFLEYDNFIFPEDETVYKRPKKRPKSRLIYFVDWYTDKFNIADYNYTLKKIKYYAKEK